MRARAVLCLPVLFSAFIAVVYGATNGDLHWTNATIPLDIDPDLDTIGLRRLHLVVDYYESATCVRFLFNDTTNHQPRLFVNSKSCCSVSYSSGERQLNIGIGISVKGMFHESIHAIGLGHTHQRPDADLYLKDNEQNEYTYEQMNRHRIPYEYASCATYQANPRDPKYANSMHRLYPSFYEILQINVMYDCFNKCAYVPKPPCQNGGVVDVNNCSKCFCPRQYAGDFCEKRSPGTAAVDCGKTIQVTETTQTLELPVQGELKDELDYTHCYYLLEAPTCKNIQVTIRDVPDRAESSCTELGLEVYPNIDKRQSEYRYCHRSQINETVMSAYNTLALDAFAFGRESYTFKIDIVIVA